MITGAAGFIGSRLAQQVVETGGASVVALDSGRSGDWSRLEVPVERLDADLATMSEQELVEACQGADVVFHLAAEKYNSSKSTPQRVFDVNVSGTARLYRAAAAAGVRKVVFTSSLYAYGSMGPKPMREDDVPFPSTEYGVSKVAGEHLLRTTERTTGLRWAVARLFFVYGPRQYAEGGYKSVILSNFERIARGEAPVIRGDGEQALDYVFLDDVVAALQLLADERHDGALCNIGSGTGVTINDLTALMLKVSGSELEPVHVDADWTAGSRRVGDAGIARGLGWEASTPFEDGLAEVWAWMTGARRG